VEQIATTPGGIERLSVAVVARSITAMDESRVKSLVAHAIGLNEQRGDSVAVVSLPPRHEEAITAQERDAAAALVGGGGHASVTDRPWGLRPLWVAVGAALVLALVGLAAGALRARAPASRLGREPVRTPTPGEVTAITDKVRQWLDEGQQHAAR
jgi:flagellar biosynthesis/type III secretory pathway M-ring protein FliF/YscJ